MRILFLVPLIGLVTIITAPYACADLESSRQLVERSSEIPLFATPDGTSPPATWIPNSEATTPLAEILQPGGQRWFLIQTKNKTVGWIKESDNDKSKTLGSFFKSLPRETSFFSRNENSAPPSTAPREPIIVPILLIGRSIIVPVTFNQSIKRNLVLDTGATSTLISKNIARTLALHETGSTTGVTVGGVIALPVARVRSLKVGTAEVLNLMVSIHDFSQDPRYEGLLGMDFLSRFEVSLDQQKRLLVLIPR